MHNLSHHLHGSCVVHPDLTLTLWETSWTMICRYSTISWLIVFQLMETWFVFAANQPQQVVHIEYAFCNVVMWSLKRVEKKDNYTLNFLMAGRKYWTLYSNPRGTLCHPWKKFCKCCDCLVCWAWNGLWFHCELRVFRFWGFGWGFRTILTVLSLIFREPQPKGKERRVKIRLQLSKMRNGNLATGPPLSKSNRHFIHS